MSSTKVPLGPQVEIRFHLDRERRWQRLDAGWRHLTGFDPHACLGRPIADFLHGDERDHAIAAIASVLSGELYSCRLPTRCLAADGRGIWVELFGFPTFDERGRVDGFSGTLVDVTDRRKGMRALRESEARFRAISEASPLGVCVTDRRGDAIFTNAVLREILDLPRVQADGFARVRTLHADDRERFVTAAEAAIASKAPFQSEHRYVHGDGAVVWCRLHAAPILDGEQLLGYVHVAEDVTAARLGEEALRVSQERLRLALEGSGVALMDMDLRSGQIFLSEQWGRFIGDEVANREWSLPRYLACVHDVDREPLQLALMETLSGQRPFLRMEYRVIASNAQQRWIETHARVVERTTDGEPLRLTGTHADITERKDLERLQAEFVATVSHELRSPLTSILGALEVVQEEHGQVLPADARRFLEVAYKNSERLFSLVNDILDLEKVERGLQSFEFGSVPVSALLEQAAGLHDAHARRRGVTLLIEPTDASLEAWSDAERLMQVLANLLSNAVKFSHPGGNVILRAHAARDHIRIEVADKGQGIPLEFQPRVFNRFAQAERVARHGVGSGLGLSICKALVEKMDGQIGFHSVPGVGTTFHVDLPIAGRALTPEKRQAQGAIEG